MFRLVILAAPLLLATSAVLPSPNDAAGAQTVSRTGEQCQERRRRGRGIGGALGGVAGAFGGRIGGVAGVVTSHLPVGSLIGEAIAALLDCDEQRKAAVATEQAVDEAERGGVGSTASWESTTRPGVSGSSTVTGIETASADGDCMTVTDIVIVEGEETRAPKRMCRRPPTNRYARV